MAYDPNAAYSLFFNPKSSYGGTYAPGDWATTPIGGGDWNSYLEDPSNRDATYLRHLAGIGGGTQPQWADPNSPQGAWARSQLGSTITGYDAALATNPLLKYQDYLSSVDLPGMYAGLTPQQQGKNPGMYAGRMRTVGRSF
jgi:hypothetical protein